MPPPDVVLDLLLGHPVLWVRRRQHVRRDRGRRQIVGPLVTLENWPWKVLPEERPQRCELVPLATVGLEQLGGLLF